MAKKLLPSNKTGPLVGYEDQIDDIGCRLVGVNQYSGASYLDRQVAGCFNRRIALSTVKVGESNFQGRVGRPLLDPRNLGAFLFGVSPKPNKGTLRKRQTTQVVALKRHIEASASLVSQPGRARACAHAYAGHGAPGMDCQESSLCRLASSPHGSIRFGALEDFLQRTPPLQIFRARLEGTVIATSEGACFDWTQPVPWQLRKRVWL